MPVLIGKKGRWTKTAFGSLEALREKAVDYESWMIHITANPSLGGCGHPIKARGVVVIDPRLHYIDVPTGELIELTGYWNTPRLGITWFHNNQSLMGMKVFPIVIESGHYGLYYPQGVYCVDSSHRKE